MPLASPRQPKHFSFATPDASLDAISGMLRNATYSLVKVMDVIDAAVTAFPEKSVMFLALAYDIYQSQNDKSRYHLYQSRVFDFNIGPNDLVLDIGSGHHPFPLATHLADISLTQGDIGRGGAFFQHVNGKPAFECCVEKTPFPDKAFDFVYCSHVLEHSQSPQAACRELIRIGKRGYIETPTRGKDVFLASARISNHCSAVELINGVLTFFRYSKDEIRGLNCDILQQMHSNPKTDREKAFSALIYLYPRAVNTMLMWEHDFSFNDLS